MSILKQHNDKLRARRPENWGSMRGVRRDFSSHNSIHMDPESHVSPTQRPVWLFTRAQSDLIVVLNFHLYQRR